MYLFIYLFDIQRHPHDIRIRAVAFLAEVRLEMVKIYYGEETDKEKGRCGNKVEWMTELPSAAAASWGATHIDSLLRI